MSDKRVTYAQAVESAGIAAALAGLDWAVVGTPPLGLDLEGSDIDIVCAAFDGADFAERLWRVFGILKRFRCGNGPAGRGRSLPVSAMPAGRSRFSANRLP